MPIKPKKYICVMCGYETFLKPDIEEHIFNYEHEGYHER